jgi:phosphoesterase RecJ-like protein
MCFDTSAFTNSATNERVLNSASELILLGARVQDVIRTMFHNRSLGALRVWGAALERLVEHEATKIVCTCLTRKDIEENDVDDDEIDGLSNFLSLVTDTDTLIVLRETSDGGVKASMRSRTHDVSAHAKLFGGGGHAKAAGFTIANTCFVCENGTDWKLNIDGVHSEIHEALRFGKFTKL